MFYNIPGTFLFIVFLNFYRKKYKNIDVYYILRFLIPWLLRLKITKKNFNNEYYDVKDYPNILLPELYIFIYDFIDRWINKQIKIDVVIHHTVTICLIIINMFLNSKYKNTDIGKIFGLYIGVNILNTHNSGDIFIRTPKVILEYNKNIGIFSGIIGLIYWIYTRNYIQYKILKKFYNDSKNINKTSVVIAKRKLILLYVLGLFYSCKVIYYFKKAINN